MTRVYATAEQYETYTGAAAPLDIDARLMRAGRFLDAQVFRFCVFAADATTGLPTDTVVAAAFANAVCAQAEWGVAVGDVTGAAGAGWGSVEIGSVRLSRSVTAVSGGDSPVGRLLRRSGTRSATPRLPRTGSGSGW